MKLKSTRFADAKPVDRSYWRKWKVWRDGIIALLFVLSLLPPASPAQALIAGQGLTWSVAADGPVTLVVCWLNPDAANPMPGDTDQSSGADRREWVRLALKSTWEREARIIFVGWQQCQNEDNPTPPVNAYGPRRPGTADENIKIQITTSGGGQNPAHGSFGEYASPSVLLNLHNSNKADYEFLAIHEFGHVLGLYHEEERTDWPTNIPNCPKQSWATSYPWWPVPTELHFGAPDRDSVMAYCSPRPNHLSPDDIVAIQHLYQRHLPGTLLSQAGSLCLSAHADAGNGDDAFGWDCDEALDDQEWFYDPNLNALNIQSNNHTFYCLDVDTNDATDVQIWSCLHGWNQQWTFQHVTLRGYGGLCLTRAIAGAGPLTMQTCTGAASQLWRIGASSTSLSVRVISDTGNLCLTLSGGSGSNATAQPCNASYLPWTRRSAFLLENLSDLLRAATGETVAAATASVKNFYLGDSGKLYTPGNLCLDVQDVWDSQYTSGEGGPAAGQRVQFFTCTGNQYNQKWSLSGNILSGTKCLSLDGTGTTHGAGASVVPCNGSIQQKWDYDW